MLCTLSTIHLYWFYESCIQQFLVNMYKALSYKFVLGWLISLNSQEMERPFLVKRSTFSILKEWVSSPTSIRNWQCGIIFTCHPCTKHWHRLWKTFWIWKNNVHQIRTPLLCLPSYKIQKSLCWYQSIGVVISIKFKINGVTSIRWKQKRKL